jgi:hypothetical protein
MSDTDVVKVLQFEKKGPKGFARCEMRVFADGSAYIRGDEIEVGFDDAPEAWKDAFPYLESRGYEKIGETVP